MIKFHTGLLTFSPSYKEAGTLRHAHLVALEETLWREVARFNDELTRQLREAVGGSAALAVEPNRQITRELIAEGSVGLNIGQIEIMYAALITRAVEAIWARARNGLHLSDRIWQAGETVRNSVRDIMMDAVARGRDAVATARELEQYLKAKTPAREYKAMMERVGRRFPKDIAYESLRLARTEMTTAFAEGTYAAGRVSPSYRGIKWVLSAAHPLLDVCDDLASGGPKGDGVYPEGGEPMVPHPNCLCIQVPAHEPPEEFVQRLKEWRDNPQLQPDLERWYNDIYKGGKITRRVTISRPAPVPGPPQTRRQTYQNYALYGGNTREVTKRRLLGGAQLVVPVDLDTTKQMLTEKQVADAFRRLPKRLRRTVREVQLADYRNPDDALWAQRYNTPGFRSWAGGGGQTIILFENGHMTVQENLDHLFGALAHEAGHNLDQKLGSRIGLTHWSDGQE